MKNMRKSRFFQRDAYISIDFLTKECEIVKMKDIEHDPEDPFAMVLDLGEGKGKKEISIHKPEVKPINAIQTELESFARAILNNETPSVTINDGYMALDIAYRILDKISY